MCIEKGYVAECDDCNDSVEVGYHDTLDEFVFEIKKKGWSVKKLNSYEMPLCYCQACTDLKEQPNDTK